MKSRRGCYNKDRLSDLPDCVLLHILSFSDIKEAVQTCILSTRWRNIWKHLSILSLNSRHFKTLGGFTKFVSRFLSLRDKKTAVQSLNFHRYGIMESQLKRILKYAASHKVQHLDISADYSIENCSLSYLSSHTLISLNICANFKYDERMPIFPNSLNLPTLTSLCIEYFAFRGSGNDDRAEPFSLFKSLSTLIIRGCEILGEQNLFISSATLVNLTIQSDDKCKIELSTPNLSSFHFKGNPVQKLGGSNRNLFSIKHVNIDVPLMSRINHLVLLNWLIELANIESLTITQGVLQILYPVPDLCKVDFPYLRNLKTLKVNTITPSSFPDGAVNFLQQKAPLAKVEIIDLSSSWFEDILYKYKKKSEVHRDQNKRGWLLKTYGF